MDSLTRQSLMLLADLVAERVGLHYDDTDLELFRSKLSERMSRAGFDSLLDYYYFLRYDAESQVEFGALVDTVVVNETYFFREWEPLEVLVDQVLAPAVARGERPRVWSAACSTGEEPLTLAMLLDQRDILDRVEIVASDVSERALRRAREGMYSGRSLRALPPGVIGKWLETRDGSMQVAARLRDAIRWERLNLLDDGPIASLGRFDAVLCRNVLIYFADATTLAVVNRLANVLKPGGWLFVGVSESLLRFGTALRCEEYRSVFCYRRPE